MEKVLITGVAGFIGSHIAKRFIKEGYHVIGIDDLSNGCISNIPKNIDFLRFDLTNYSEYKNIPKGCINILHLAGQSSGEISYHEPAKDLEKNTLSTLNLIKYGIKNHSKKIIYASSMSIYGDVDLNSGCASENLEPNPKSCYGISKLASEKYLNLFKDKLPFIAMRMFNVYGPGQDMDNMKQGMVSIYLSQAIKLKKISIKGSLSRFRDFIYIDDVVESWFKASISESALNQAINIGTGRKTTVNQIIKIIKEITKVNDIEVQEGTPCDQLGIYADNSKLKSLLNFTPKVDLMNGLKDFYNWAKIFD